MATTLTAQGVIPGPETTGVLQRHSQHGHNQGMSEGDSRRKAPDESLKKTDQANFSLSELCPSSSFLPFMSPAGAEAPGWWQFLKRRDAGSPRSMDETSGPSRDRLIIFFPVAPKFGAMWSVNPTLMLWSFHPPCDRPANFLAERAVSDNAFSRLRAHADARDRDLRWGMTCVPRLHVLHTLVSL